MASDASYPVRESILTVAVWAEEDASASAMQALNSVGTRPSRTLVVRVS